MRRLRVWWKDEFDECGPDQDVEGEAIVPEPGQVVAPGWDAYTTTLGLLQPSRKVDIDDVDDAAEAYADYFFSQRDGYENTWPLEFVVLDRHDGTYHVVEIAMEMEPTFRTNNRKPYVSPAKKSPPALTISVGDLLYANLGDGREYRFKVEGWQDEFVFGITEDHRPIRCSRSLLSLHPALNAATVTATNDDKEKQSHG